MLGMVKREGERDQEGDNRALENGIINFEVMGWVLVEVEYSFQVRLSLCSLLSLQLCLVYATRYVRIDDILFTNIRSIASNYRL